MLELTENHPCDASAASFHAACGKNDSNYLWLVFNERLEQDATPLNLSERWLVEKYIQWSTLDSSNSRMKWLSLARVNELAILCTGNYIDNGELTAAGDLLVNPRMIHVYLDGRRKPIVKRRHGRMSSQFSHLALPGQPITTALATRTRIAIHNEPLLPEIYGQLEISEYISKSYLLSVGLRMQTICEAINFITAWHLPADTDLQLAIKTASGADRALLQTKLCRFDKRVFDAMGEHLRNLLAAPHSKSPFLN